MAEASSSSTRWRRPAQHFPLVPHLAVIPVLLAVATAVLLFVHSDVNAALLWSQCHSRALLPGLSRIPLLGTPSCFLVSFLHAALDSVRSRAVLGAILGFVGALLTVSTLESARRVNAGNLVVARPTLPWLVFNLVGGALVWQIVIVPAFILAAKQWPPHAKSSSSGPHGYDDGHEDEEQQQQQVAATAAATDGRRDDPLQIDRGRQVARTEVIAIPIAVALGYYAPSLAMLITASPVAIGVWLFFPLYVSIVRQGVRLVLGRLRPFRRGPTIHLESHIKSLAAMYALPVLCSLAAHGFLIASLAKPDDRRELTRSTSVFVEIDFQFVGLTFLYWALVEVGWRLPLAIVALSLLLGPGAGTALGWLYREKLITSDLVLQLHTVVEEEAEEAANAQRGPDEETPLIP